MKSFKILLPLLLNFALAACGQPGPLYLPDKVPPALNEPTHSTP